MGLGTAKLSCHLVFRLDTSPRHPPYPFSLQRRPLRCYTRLVWPAGHLCKVCFAV